MAMLYYSEKREALAVLQRVRKAGATADMPVAQGGGWYVTVSSVGQSWLKHAAIPRSQSHDMCELCLDYHANS